ncbi:DOMON domain-containing protein [Entamoeba marina]
MLFLFIIPFLVNADDLMIYEDGAFQSGWKIKQSTGYTSTAVDFQGVTCFFITLSKNNYANFVSETAVDITKYKYFSFIVSWEQIGCSLSLNVVMGADDELYSALEVTTTMKVNNWNRVYVELNNSVNNTNIDLVRIVKTDKTDSNLYFDDIKFTNDLDGEGYFSYSTDKDDFEGNHAFGVIVLFGFFVLLLL